MKALILLAVIMMFVAGCSSVRTIDSSSDLHALVGQKVHFEGLLDDKRKEPWCVVIPNGDIYLTDNTDIDGHKVTYGSTVMVEGKLMYFHDPGPSTEEEKRDDAFQRPSDHFFIENAKVRVLKPPSVTP